MAEANLGNNYQLVAVPEDMRRVYLAYSTGSFPLMEKGVPAAKNDITSLTPLTRGLFFEGLESALAEKLRSYHGMDAQRLAMQGTTQQLADIEATLAKPKLKGRLEALKQQNAVPEHTRAAAQKVIDTYAAWYVLSEIAGKGIEHYSTEGPEPSQDAREFYAKILEISTEAATRLAEHAKVAAQAPTQFPGQTEIDLEEAVETARDIFVS